MLYFKVTKDFYNNLTNKIKSCKDLYTYVFNFVTENYHVYVSKYEIDNYKYLIEGLLQIERDLERNEEVLKYKSGYYIFNTSRYFEKCKTFNANYKSLKCIIEWFNILHFKKFLAKNGQAFEFSTLEFKEFYDNKFDYSGNLILTEEELIKHIDKDFYKTINILPKYDELDNPPKYEEIY